MTVPRSAEVPRWVRDVIAAAYAQSARKAIAAGESPAPFPNAAAQASTKSRDDVEPVVTIGREGVDGLLDALGLLARHQDLLPRAVADHVIAAIEAVLGGAVDLPPRRLRKGQQKLETMRRTGLLARRNGTPRAANPYPTGRGFAEVSRRAWDRGWSEEDLRVRKARAVDLFACRLLTMQRPHGRAHEVSDSEAHEGAAGCE